MEGEPRTLKTTPGREQGGSSGQRKSSKFSGGRSGAASRAGDGGKEVGHLPCSLKHQVGYPQHLGPLSIRGLAVGSKKRVPRTFFPPPPQYQEDTSHLVHGTRTVPTSSTVPGTHFPPRPRYQEHTSHLVHGTRNISTPSMVPRTYPPHQQYQEPTSHLVHSTRNTLTSSTVPGTHPPGPRYQNTSHLAHMSN